MRVAIVHDWLTTYAGAEKTLEQMLAVFPSATLYSLLDFMPPDQRRFLRDRPVKTTFIQRMPLARRNHRVYIPLMPLAIESLDLSGYDVVLSSSYAVAKGVLTGPDQLHVSYCYSPMRYAWDLQHQYLGESGLRSGVRSLLARILLHYIRMWDVRTAAGVDHFVAISDFIARRIRKVYRREASVIYPPVDVSARKVRTEKEDFYVTVSRLVPYKKVPLIIEAFSRMPEKKLVVIGDGPELGKARACAGPNVQVLGRQPYEAVNDAIAKARAFVFAAEEDFGIAPVEAQACGTPVIAYGKGGSTETVVPGKTGLFFSEQTVEAICDAVQRFEACRSDFDPAQIRANAERFSDDRFREELGRFVHSAWAAFQAGSRGSAVHEDSLVPTGRDVMA